MKRAGDAGPARRTAKDGSWFIALGLLVAFAGLTCGDARPLKYAAPPNDAGADRVTSSDGGTTGVALDFSATGCASFDSAAYRCRGTAPLTISFVAIATEDLTRLLWTFGDSTAPSSETTARHTYTVPGVYDVTLVAGARSGTLSRERKGFVEVLPASTGDGCDVDLQCAEGLTCLCGAAATCHEVFRRGLCSRRCGESADVCPANTTCADLSQGQRNVVANTDDDATWRQPLCLGTCTSSAGCPPGHVCRELPGRAGSAWVRACFPAYPYPIGAACRNADGALVDRDCITGLCVDLGFGGRCARACAGDADCPTATRCAHFNDGRALCLAACAPGQSCADDPLLSCEEPGAPGAFGFTVAADASPTIEPVRLCAPKQCATDADCGLAGTCDRHCRRR